MAAAIALALFVLFVIGSPVLAIITLRRGDNA